MRSHAPLSGPELSILLPVRDGGIDAQRCIISIAEHTDPQAGYELVVVDASGSPAFAAFAGAIEGAVKWVKAPPRAGLAGLLGLGAEAASAANLVLLDERVQVTEGWLPGLLEASAALSGQIGVIGGAATSSAGAVVEAGLAYEGADLVSAARIFKTEKNAYLQAAFRPLAVAGRVVAMLSARTLTEAGPPEDGIDYEWAWAAFCLRCHERGGAVGLAPRCRAVVSSAPLPPPDPRLRPAAWPHRAPEGAPSLRRAVVAAMLAAGQIRFTGERAIPEAPDMNPAVMREHIVRYEHVAPKVADKQVLDAACGSGYGSQILAAVAAQVVGVDHDAEAVSVCRATRNAPNLRFVQADVAATGLPDRSFDAIVGFETIEHLHNGHPYLVETCRLLRDGGELWLSTPFGGAAESNPFHLSVYQLANFQAFLRGYFEDVIPAYQRGEAIFVEPESPSRSPQFTGEYGIMRCLRPRRFVAGLVSIVIPVHNQAGLTRECLLSIRRNTRPPHEVIVVDDASTDGTPRVLAGQRGLRVLTNPRNLGFAASVNRGIRAAAGDHVLILNNDTLVTPGWLEGLLRHAAEPGVGMVGAVSNYAADWQRFTELSYRNVEELEIGAAALARSMAGQKHVVPKITGLCALIKRDLIQRIGGFDTRFGLGYCEDDDFCIRAGLAGFAIVVARDVFIHHYGSRTIAAAMIDPERLMQSNWKVFKAKWRLDFAGHSDLHAQIGPAYAELSRRKFAMDTCYDASLWTEPGDSGVIQVPVGGNVAAVN